MNTDLRIIDELTPRIVPLGDGRYMVVSRDEYIAQLSEALLAWRDEARMWVDVDFPDTYSRELDEQDERLKKYQPLIDQLLRERAVMLDA